MSLTGCETLKKDIEAINARGAKAGDDRKNTVYRTEREAKTAAEVMERANQALQSGDEDRALYYYFEAYERDKANYEALYRAAVIHAKRGNYVRAEQALRLALQAKEAYPDALEELGMVMLRKRDYDAALAQLKKALELEPNRWRVHNGLGVIADLRSDHPAARIHYETALRFEPNSPVVWNNLGYSQYLAGEWEAASTSIRKALDRDPGYEKAWSNIALIHVRKEEYSDALAALRHVMQTPNALEQIGYLCMLQGRYDKAEQFLEQAVDQSPTYFKEAHDKLAQLEGLRARAIPAAGSSVQIPATGATATGAPVPSTTSATPTQVKKKKTGSR